MLQSKVLDRIWLLSLGNTFNQVGDTDVDQDQKILRLSKKHKGFFVPFAYLDFTQNDVVGANKIIFGSDTRGDGPIKKALFWKSYIAQYLGEAVRDKNFIHEEVFRASFG